MVKKLKRKKACGHDGILAEHLIWGGDAVLSWLLTILNCIVELEEVPRSMKMGLLSPVFKGRGRDPQLVDSYRGLLLHLLSLRFWSLLFVTGWVRRCLRLEFRT